MGFLLLLFSLNSALIPHLKELAEIQWLFIVPSVGV